MPNREPATRPPYPDRILAKIANNSTTKSHVYLVWTAVVYFEAHNVVTAGNPDGVPQIGARMTDLPIHRKFMVVDMSQVDTHYDKSTGQFHRLPPIHHAWVGETTPPLAGFGPGFCVIPVRKTAAGRVSCRSLHGTAQNSLFTALNTSHNGESSIGLLRNATPWSAVKLSIVRIPPQFNCPGREVKPARLSVDFPVCSGDPDDVSSSVQIQPLNSAAWSLP